MSTGAPEKKDTTLSTNRKARHDYHILDSWEVGLSLTGSEVKSCRAGQVSLAEAFAAFDAKKDLYLQAMRVQPYAASTHQTFIQHDPVRPRKILMHRRELNQLATQVQVKGFALVPLKLYTARGKIKLELGLGRGKLQEDKRETLKRRTADKEMARAIGARRG